jgi:tRNA(Ile)-lysidine synthase
MLFNFRPTIESDNFVLAVSGGVDSVVLLHILSSMDYSFVVAHYDHGIRDNSNVDRKFVEKLAKQYNKQFYFEEGHLGPAASEELARNKRYYFLDRIKAKTNSNLIVTAHHQDDYIETAMINILRGTGRVGLSSLSSNPLVIRPLINFSKKDIVKYAETNNLKWVEDTTNQDPSYLRNNLRINIIPKMTTEQRNLFLQYILTAKELNKKIEPLIKTVLLKIQHKGQPVINRAKFIMLEDRLAHEFMHYFLRSFSFKGYDKKTIDLLVVGIKTLKPGKIIDVPDGKILLTKRSARFINKVLD